VLEFFRNYISLSVHAKGEHIEILTCVAPFDLGREGSVLSSEVEMFGTGSSPGFDNDVTPLCRSPCSDFASSSV
jgi:hypothetical protein